MLTSMTSNLNTIPQELDVYEMNKLKNMFQRHVDTKLGYFDKSIKACTLEDTQQVDPLIFEMMDNINRLVSFGSPVAIELVV